jgi:ATP-binding protein involved in chromosome partitioning
LEQIPLVESICESGDSGAPSVLNDNALTAKYFMDLAQKVNNKINS